MLVTPELNKVASADEVFSTPAAAPVVPTAKQVNREAKRLFREALAVQSETTENLDVTTLESDLIHYLRTGQVSYQLAGNEYREEKRAEGETEAENQADTRAQIALQEAMCKKLLSFLDAHGAVFGPAKKKEARARLETKPGEQFSIKISVFR